MAARRGAVRRTAISCCMDMNGVEPGRCVLDINGEHDVVTVLCEDRFSGHVAFARRRRTNVRNCLLLQALVIVAIATCQSKTHPDAGPRRWWIC